MQAPQLASGPPTLVRPPCLPAPGTILGSLVSPHETAIEDIIRYDNACRKTRKPRRNATPSFVRKTCHTGGPTLTVSFNFESIAQVVNWCTTALLAQRGHRQNKGYKLSPRLHKSRSKHRSTRRKQTWKPANWRHTKKRWWWVVPHPQVAAAAWHRR